MNRTRIYVFLGPVYALVNMMEAMDAVQLFSKGEYMVIFVDMMTYSTREAQKYIWKPDHLNKHASCKEIDNFKQRARSLLVIVSSPPAENYESFTEQVREYNKKEPFFFQTPTFFKKYIKVVEDLGIEGGRSEGFPDSFLTVCVYLCGLFVRFCDVVFIGTG